MCVQLSCLQLAACKDSLPMVGDQEGVLGYPNSLISDQRASPIILQQWQTCKHCASRKEEALYGDY